MKLQAKSGNKITDKNRTFFNDFIYVPDNYNANDYEEVGEDVWKHFVNDETPKIEEPTPQTLFLDNEDKVKNLEDQVEQLTALVQSLLERVPE